MKWITRQYRKRFAPQVISGREMYFPHLYLTYCFMNLAASVTYEAFGRAVFLDVFRWYFAGGYDQWLLTASIVVFFLRVKYRQMEQLPSKNS